MTGATELVPEGKPAAPQFRYKYSLVTNRDWAL